MLNFFLSRSKPEKNRLNQNRPNNKSWIFDQREKKKRTKLFFCRSGEKLDRFIIFGAILIGLTGYFSRRKLPNWPSRPTAADSARSNFLLPLKNYLWVWPTLVFFAGDDFRFRVPRSIYFGFAVFVFRKKWTDWSNFYRPTNLAEALGLRCSQHFQFCYLRLLSFKHQLPLTLKS